MTDPNSPERIHPEEPEMNASSPQPLAAEPYDDYDGGGFDDELPVRPRPSYLTPLTALLMALILGGVGFYVGIRVEKSKTTSSTGGASAFARAFSGTAGTAGATKVSKSENVSRKKLYPGDGVVIAGSASSNGTVHATSVTDSGASSTGASSTGASSTSGSSSTSNSTSAIGSLFGSG